MTVITIEAQEIEVMEDPYTEDQLKVIYTENPEAVLTGVIAVDLSDLMDNTFSDILDILSEGLIGSQMLMEVNYSPVAVNKEDNIIYMQVSGYIDATELLEDEDI